MCIAQRSCSGLIDSSKVLKIYLVILQSKVLQPSTGFCINAMMKFKGTFLNNNSEPNPQHVDLTM